MSVVEICSLIEELHVAESPSSRVKAHHIEWIIAPNSSYRAWLEENKSPFPLAGHLIYHNLHHRPLRSLKWLRKNAMV